MNNRIVIAVSGKKDSGKNLFLNVLNELRPNCNFKEVKFAGGVKQISSVLTGLPLECFYNKDYYNKTLSECGSNLGYNETIRSIQQKIGTEVFRQGFDFNIWCNFLNVTMNSEEYKNSNLVITDVRFPNELEFVNKIDNSYSVRINIKQKDDKNSNHLSETALDDMDSKSWDFEFWNDQTDLQKFTNNVKLFLKHNNIN